MLFPHTFGIVVIMKNEAPYVKEWLDYHLNAGVDIVYIYDNDSEDNLEEIVAPYVNKGRVIYQKFPGDVPQLRCYHDAIIKYRFSCKYLAFIDADEFIYPTNNGSIKDFIEKFFEGKENLAGLYAYWLFFGSSGEEKADLSRGVLERFQKRASSPIEFGKIILNPRKVFDFSSTPHHPSVFTNSVSLNEAEIDVYEAEKNKTYPADKIFVAHFAAKSKEEWLKRKSKGSAFRKRQVNLNEDGSIKFGLFDSIDQNHIEDKKLYEYYLKNIKNPLPSENVKIEICAQNALEILVKKEINFEEYFSAIHILKEAKYFEEKSKLKERKKLLKSAFLNASKTVNETYMDLFFEELPFFIKLNVAEKEELKKLALKYYNHLQITLLSDKNYNEATRLREIKKYIDII